jgi:hypothetical protein
MIGGLAPHRGVGMAHASKLVVGILEQVRIDGPDLEAEAVGEVPQLRVVHDLVPWDVDRDGRRDPRVPVHLSGVLELLEGISGSARLSKHREPRPRVAVAPRGRGDALASEALFDGRYIDASGPQASGRCSVVGHTVLSFIPTGRGRPPRTQPAFLPQKRGVFGSKLCSLMFGSDGCAGLFRPVRTPLIPLSDLFERRNTRDLLRVVPAFCY